MGRYDPKTDNIAVLPIMVSFRHIKSNAIPLWEALDKIFILFWYINELWAISEEVMTTPWKFDELPVLSAVWFNVSVLSDLSLKPQTNQRMLTFKVKVKVK